MTIESLAKIGRATDPRSTAIAVDFDGGQVRMWALVDHQERHYGSLIFDTDEDAYESTG